MSSHVTRMDGVFQFCLTSICLSVTSHCMELSVLLFLKVNIPRLFLNSNFKDAISMKFTNAPFAIYHSYGLFISISSWKNPAHWLDCIIWQRDGNMYFIGYKAVDPVINPWREYARNCYSYQLKINKSRKAMQHAANHKQFYL